MTTLIDPYPIDTTDDSHVWVVARRVHWHADDLIAHQLHNRNIRTTDRRLLDAMYYTHACGQERATTAALCALAPMFKIQTASSILERLRGKGLVGRGTAADGRTREWWLTSDGHELRKDYCGEAERQLQNTFDTRSGLTSNILLDRVPAALDLVDGRLFPRVQHHAAGDAKQPDPPSTLWSALRRVHLHITDCLYHETETYGIGPVERRVLDALGYARKMEVSCLNVGTMCRLSEAVTRTVVQTALENLRSGGLVSRTARDGRNLWALTSTGDLFRESYKRATQLRLRETYDPDGRHTDELLTLMRRAHQSRDRRLQQALAYFARPAGNLAS